MSDETRTSVEISRGMGEPLYGTTSRADVFFLVEYNGIYTNQAWEDARISEETKAHLMAYPNSKALLIRQPGQLAAHDRKVQFYVVDAAAQRPVYYRFDLEDYDELLTLDFDAVLAGTVFAPQASPVYAVCTNGRRDVCCSKYGIPVYETLASNVTRQVWQVSHIGGHRFAGTLYCFPHAIAYGGLDGNDAPEIATAYERGELVLLKYRGRATMDKPLQAAEYFLRREFDLTAIDALTLLDHEQDEAGRWRVRFRWQTDRYEVTLSPADPLRVLATTGQDTWKIIPQYHYDNCQRL